MMQTFYTMMEHLENTHLIKDVGMIPYMLTKQKLMKGFIVGYNKPREEFTYLDTDVVGLEYVNRKKYTGNTIVDGCIWLSKYAKKIDCLNLYHYKVSTFIWIIVYKIFNPQGNVYVKLDIDSEAGMQMKMKKNSLKWFWTKNVLGRCKVVSCETEIFGHYTKMNWPINVDYIPNGIMEKDIKVANKKEKIVLSVGRLGTNQKATEILVESFIKAIDQIDREWKLILVGSMENDFCDYFDLIVNEGGFKDRIIYLGKIENRKELDKLYSRASIFTIPSRGESFGLVALEALAKGDYLLTTNLTSFLEISNNGRFGDTIEVDDVEAYANKLIYLCNDGYDMDTNAVDKFLRSKYSYERICERLNFLLKNGNE